MTDSGGSLHNRNAAPESLQAFLAVRSLRRTLIALMKFGGVGLCATLVHVSVFSALIELFGVSPLSANVLAFCFAFVVSFLGHFYWTFAQDDENRRYFGAAFARFVIVALLGLGLNSLVVFTVDVMLGWPYLFAVLGMIFGVPPILFILSRYWAFFRTGGL